MSATRESVLPTLMRFTPMADSVARSKLLPCTGMRTLSGRSTELEDCCDLLFRAQTGRIEYLCSCLLKGLEAADGVRKIGIAGDEVLRAGGEDEWCGQGAGSLCCGADALDRVVQGIDAAFGPRRDVFNGATGEAGCGGQADGFCAGFGRVAKAVFQVCANGQVRRGDDIGNVREHGIAADGTVLETGGECVSGGGGGQSLKSHAGQQARGSGVPGIGDDERAAALVERPKT